jgi:hypothetical protein
MELESIASGLAAGSVSSSVNIGVLNAVNTLDQSTAAVLFSSLGIGGGVDTYA